MPQYGEKKYDKSAVIDHITRPFWPPIGMERHELRLWDQNQDRITCDMREYFDNNPEALSDLFGDVFSGNTGEPVHLTDEHAKIWAELMSTFKLCNTLSWGGLA